MPPSRPQECHCGPPDPAEWWAATEWCPCRPPPLCFQVSPSCHPTAVPKGSPGARVPPASRVGPPRPCPPQGQGAGTRGKSEPLQAGTAGTGSVGGWGQPGHGQLLGQVTPVPSVPWGTRAMGNLRHGKLMPWGGRRGPKPHQRSSTLGPSGCQSQPQAMGWGGWGALAVPPRPPLSSGQPKVRGSAAPCPPAARQPRARATTVPVPSGRPLVPSAIPRAPGRTPVGAPAPRGKDGCGWGGGQEVAPVPQFPHAPRLLSPLQVRGRHGRPPGLLAQGANPPPPPAASAPPGRRQ